MLYSTLSYFMVYSVERSEMALGDDVRSTPEQWRNEHMDIIFSIPQGLWTDLMYLTREKGTTVNQQIENALAMYIKADKKKKAKNAK